MKKNYVEAKSIQEICKMFHLPDVKNKLFIHQKSIKNDIYTGRKAIFIAFLPDNCR